MLDEHARMSQYEAEGAIDDIFDDDAGTMGFWARFWSGIWNAIRRIRL